LVYYSDREIVSSAFTSRGGAEDGLGRVITVAARRARQYWIWTKSYRRAKGGAFCLKEGTGGFGMIRTAEYSELGAGNAGKISMR